MDQPFETIRIKASDFIARHQEITRDECGIQKIKAILDRFDCFSEEAKQAYEEQLQKKYSAQQKNPKSHKQNARGSRQQPQQQHPQRAKSESLVSLMNKINEANYDKLYSRVLSRNTDIDLETILKKVEIELGYVGLYARLLKDLLRDRKVTAEKVAEEIDARILFIRDFVNSYDHSSRISCDYDTFCRGGITANKVKGINSLVLNMYVINSGIFFLESLSTPMEYFTSFLLKLHMNEISIQLVQEYLAKFPSAPATYMLEKLFLLNKEGLSNKARFAIEACIRPK